MKNKMKLISMVVVIMIMIFTLLSVVYEVKADFNPGNIINKLELKLIQWMWIQHR